MIVLAANVPDNSGYVVAAYLVFFALLVVYLVITAYRLLGLERRLTALTDDEPGTSPPADADADAEAAGDRETRETREKDPAT